MTIEHCVLGKKNALPELRCSGYCAYLAAGRAFTKNSTELALLVFVLQRLSVSKLPIIVAAQLADSLSVGEGRRVVGRGWRGEGIPSRLAKRKGVMQRRHQAVAERAATRRTRSADSCRVKAYE